MLVVTVSMWARASVRRACTQKNRHVFGFVCVRARAYLSDECTSVCAHEQVNVYTCIYCKYILACIYIHAYICTYVRIHARANMHAQHHAKPPRTHDMQTYMCKFHRQVHTFLCTYAYAPIVSDPSGSVLKSNRQLTRAPGDCVLERIHGVYRHCSIVVGL